MKRMMFHGLNKQGIIISPDFVLEKNSSAKQNAMIEQVWSY